MFGGRTRIRALAVSAVGIVPAIAAAADCKLSVHATPQVLHSGQRANVEVLAHVPAMPAPGGAYAFASTTFDVYATHPAWTFASAGAIVGNDALGASLTQLHSPQRGIFADASNPIRIWHGTFTPQSDGPALVEIEADPATFSVYPSKLTSSSVECDAEGGSDYILVNPLRVGRRWLAAPGAGTSIQTDDVIVDGRIITGENWNSVKIATFICPADVRPAQSFDQLDPVAESRNGDDIPVEVVSLHYTQAPVSTSTRVEFDQAPESFTASVQAQRGDVVPTTQFSLNFQKIEFPMDEPYTLCASRSVADGGPRVLAFDGYLGGVRVASGGLDGNLQTAELTISTLPQTIEAHFSGALRSVAGNNTSNRAGPDVYRSLDGGMTWTLVYDQPVVAIVRGPNGNPLTVTLDRIEIGSGPIGEAGAAKVDDGPAAARPIQPQWKLGCHIFEAEGVQRMRVTPAQDD